MGTDTIGHGIAGGRILTFLAGCPDHARGAVLHQPHVMHTQPMLHDNATVVPDSNPYAYLSIMSEASGAKERSAKSDGLSNGNGSSAAVSNLVN